MVPFYNKTPITFCFIFFSSYFTALFKKKNEIIYPKFVYHSKYKLSLILDNPIGKFNPFFVVHCK